MAASKKTYSKTCSAVGGFSYAGNFKLYVELTETSVSVTNNTSKVKYNVYCKKPDADDGGQFSARHAKYFKINGKEIVDETESVTLNDGTYTIASGTTSAITHNDDGSKSVSFEASFIGATFGVSAKITGTYTLDTIARQSTTSSVPNFTAPNAVTCSVSRSSSSFTHEVVLQLKNSAGEWKNAVKKTGIGTSATFSGTDDMKAVFDILAGRASCVSRFRIKTYSGDTQIGDTIWGTEGTCTAAAANTCTCPTFTATNSATTTITKGNSAFTSTISITINGQTIGSVSQTSDTSFTFNNTTALRKACFTGLAQANSKSYSVSITTYYSGVKVRSTVSGSGTCNAPNIDTASAPNINPLNSFTCTVSTANSALSRSLSFQIQNSSGSWVTIASQGTTTATSFTWVNTEAHRDIIFGALNGASSRATRIIVTTYYEGVQVRGSSTTASGTCTSPNASTCSTGTWTAGQAFVCKVNRVSDLFTHTIVLQVTDKNGTLQSFESVTKSSSTTINFANSVALNTTLFNLLAQRASTTTKITITTYYKNIVVQSAKSANGVVSIPDVSYVDTTTKWMVGENQTFTVISQNTSFLHSVRISLGSDTITEATNIVNKLEIVATDEHRAIAFKALDRTSVWDTYSARVVTYYNGVQVGAPKTTTGQCVALGLGEMVLSSEWIAGNTLSQTLKCPVDYLNYTVTLSVGSVLVKTIRDVFSYVGQQTLGFCRTADEHFRCYQGLAQKEQETATFRVQAYYVADNEEVIPVGPVIVQTNICKALTAATIEVPEWIVGNLCTVKVTVPKSELYTSVKLFIDNNTNAVQEIQSNTYDSTSYDLTFGDQVSINQKIYEILNQRASASAYFEITTYYADTTGQLVQIRTPVKITGTCNALNKITGTLSKTPEDLTSNINSVIIGTENIKCTLSRDNNDFNTQIDVICNEQFITSMTTAIGENGNEAIFDTTTYINELTKTMPESSTATIEFSIQTLYHGELVQTPYKVSTQVEVNEELVKVKNNGVNEVGELISPVLEAIILNKNVNDFIDNTTMITNKKSSLLLSIEKGLFYIESKYGGFIKQIRVQITDENEKETPLEVASYNFTEEQQVYNLTKTRVVNVPFEGVEEENNWEQPGAIKVGPYDFTDLTTNIAPKNRKLKITAIDSRGFSNSVNIKLLILPYKAPEILINVTDTHRITSTPDEIEISLNGSLSPLYKINGGAREYTNLIKNIEMRYRIYGSTEEFNILKIPFLELPESSEFNYLKEKVNSNAINSAEVENAGYSLKTNTIDIMTAINENLPDEEKVDFYMAPDDTFEVVFVVKDHFGEENTDSIIIIPNTPALSFRNKRVGVNIIPRRIDNMTTRESEEDENPSLDVYGYIYSNGREVPVFVIEESWEE